MKNYNDIAGVVSENELDELMEENVNGGAIPEIVLVTIDITVAITVGWKYCPTSGCTYSCRF